MVLCYGGPSEILQIHIQNEKTLAPDVKNLKAAHTHQVKFRKKYYQPLGHGLAKLSGQKRMLAGCSSYVDAKCFMCIC